MTFHRRFIAFFCTEFVNKGVYNWNFVPLFLIIHTNSADIKYTVHVNVLAAANIKES